MSKRSNPNTQDHREVTSTGGHFADEAKDRGAGPVPEAEREAPKSGRKEGEDAWHNRANRSSEKGDGAETMGGGNRARIEIQDTDPESHG